MSEYRIVDAPDTAHEEHLILRAFPEHKRPAAAMLLDLPPTYPLAEALDPNDDTIVLETLYAPGLLAALWQNLVTAEQVVDNLTRRRLVRPGLDGASDQ